MSEPSPLLPPVKPETTAPRLWRGEAFIADDWSALADDAPLPIGGKAIISLTRWRSDQQALASTGIPIGLRVEAGEAIDEASDDIARLAVISLAFPKFTDGRAYSTARRLREAGYSGEIRATGDVLLDQLPLMLRAGFDAFVITNASTARALEAAPIPAVSRVYQAGAPVRTQSPFARRSHDRSVRQIADVQAAGISTSETNGRGASPRS